MHEDPPHPPEKKLENALFCVRHPNREWTKMKLAGQTSHLQNAKKTSEGIKRCKVERVITSFITVGAW